MEFYNINTKSVNVELTREQQHQIWKHVTPLFRLLPKAEPQCDIVIRKVEKPLHRTLYFIALRFEVGDTQYYAVYQSVYFSRGLRFVCADVRKQISRTYNPQTEMVEHLRREAHHDLFAKMFM